MPSENDRRSGEDRRTVDQAESHDERRHDKRRHDSNRRTEARIRKRLPCEFVDGDTRVQGVVLDVSLRGLFVQTHKPVQLGVELAILFTPPGLDKTIEVHGRIVRSLRVPRHLASVASGGVGVRIHMAPPEYYDYVASLTSHETEPAKPNTAGAKAAASVEPEKPKAAPKPKKRKLPPRMPKPEPKTSYRVQAKQAGGPRTRSLTVSATSREHAASQVLAELGNSWKVVDVEGA